MVKICKNGLPSGYNGHYHNPEYIKKQRESHIGLLSGDKHPNWKGRITSKKIKIYERISKEFRTTQKEYLYSNRNPFKNSEIQKELSRRGKFKLPPSYFLKANKDPEFIKLRLKGLIRHPNSIEKKMIDLLKKYNFPYKFVGDGSFLIGYKNPDFVNINGEKKIIEVFGDYWHNRPNMKWHQTEFGTHAIYSQYGFKVLIIYESELNKHIEEVIERIKNFEER